MVNNDNLYFFDKTYRKNNNYIAGVDEAGRGPLAGPVVAVAIILPAKFNSNLINDSKKLSPKKREKAFFLLKDVAIDFAVTSIGVKRIEEVNILNAALEAMRQSVNKLKIEPDIALVDGNRSPNLNCKEELIVGGDKKSLSIAAASIIAKYIRDKIMINYSKFFPEYEFDKHKGYPTKKHRELIKQFGACRIHRKNFKLV